MNRPIERLLGIRNFIWYNLLFWGAAAILELIQTLSFSNNFNFDFDTQWLLRWPLSPYLTYWALSFAVIYLYIYSIRWARTKFVLAHLVFSLLFGWAHKLMSPVVGLLLERLFYSEETFTIEQVITSWGTNSFSFLSGTVFYWLMIIIFQALHYYNRFKEQHSIAIELEGELGSARLNQIKMQLHPHFLFNAFNTISMMVRKEKGEEAVNMISDLSDMLRQSMNKESRQFVKLSEELDLIRKYLSIESYRYKGRVSVKWDVDESLNDQMVPSLILQPLVENAFKHGISKTIESADLRITCKKEQDSLVMEVFNSGPPLPVEWEFQKTKGIGLANTSERLTKLYDKDFKFLISEKEDGILVSIHIPIQK